MIVLLSFLVFSTLIFVIVGDIICSFRRLRGFIMFFFVISVLVIFVGGFVFSLI